MVHKFRVEQLIEVPKRIDTLFQDWHLEDSNKYIFQVKGDILVSK